jgi:hypothetical protein
MNEETAVEFYERVTQGVSRTRTITLEHSSGATLDGVEMSPVDKTLLASVIERLPDTMFEAAQNYDGDNPEEDLADDDLSLSTINADTVQGFEDLCKESLNHPDLAPPQMNSIIKNLNFEVLFELGSEIMDMSIEDDNSVRDFQEHD